jgi:hypothetical protein
MVGASTDALEAAVWCGNCPALSDRTPQLCSRPELTFLKGPVGDFACPWVLRPQQLTVLSVRSPQVWWLPVLTLLKVPAGGFACPSSPAPSQRYPKQKTVLSSAIPQPWVPSPTLICFAVTVSGELDPEHASLTCLVAALSELRALLEALFERFSDFLATFFRLPVAFLSVLLTALTRLRVAVSFAFAFLTFKFALLHVRSAELDEAAAARGRDSPQLPTMVGLYHLPSTLIRVATAIPRLGQVTKSRAMTRTFRFIPHFHTGYFGEQTPGEAHDW